MDTTLLLVPAVMFAAALCRATFGFGDALVAMPLLLLFLPPRLATAVVAALGFALGLVMLARDWQLVDWRATRRLLVAAVVGVPFGLAMLSLAPGGLIKGVLGVSVMGYGVYSLAGLVLPTVVSGWWTALFGFLAGALGSAYNISGPPVVLYGSMCGWTPEQFRTSLQGFFVPIGGVIVASHAIGGYWTAQTATLTALAAPAMMLGLWLGGVLRAQFDAARFRRALDVLLVILGAMLVFG